MASKPWPSPDSDGRIRIAVRFSGDVVEEAGRLLRSWQGHGIRGIANPEKDLARLPWLEETADGIHVVFEARPGRRNWMKWPSSFLAWVRRFGGDLQPVAMVDLVGGTIRPIHVAASRPLPGGPADDEEWTPGQGAESPASLYREMMNTAVSPLLRATGYRREGQSFDKKGNGSEAYVRFQKNRWNTKLDVSFTINVSVVNPRVVEEQRRAADEAATASRPYPAFIPSQGQWGGRVGPLLGLPDRWWTIRSRQEMEADSREVVSVLRDRILPIMERELDRNWTRSPR